MPVLELELLTPERVVSREPVNFVVVPASNGEMGILPGHAPFLVQLKSGEVRVKKSGGLRHFAVSGGFAEIRRNQVSLFAETAEAAESIDAERARQALEKAKAEISKEGLDPLTLAAAEAALRRAEVRLQVSARKPRAAR